MAEASTNTTLQKQSSATPTNEPIEDPDDAPVVQALLASLFSKHQERAEVQKRSKELDAEMKKIKARCERWMRQNESEDIGLIDFGRKLRRTERKVKRKVNVDTLLDWIETDYGIAARRQYEERRRREEQTVRDTRVEYRITYSGMRKRGQRVANASGQNADSGASSNSASATTQSAKRPRLV
jgi:hypothetical protein